jgi:fructokinase
VGDDPLGHEILARLGALGQSTRYIHVDARHPTGTVTVELDADGKPYYVIHEDVAWDAIPPKPILSEPIDAAEAICFGSLAQRSPVSRATIRDLVNAAPEDCLRVFDVNLRQHYFNRDTICRGLEQAHIVKLNDEELPVVAELAGIDADGEEAIETLVDHYQLDLMAMTRGPRGALLISPEERSDHPGVEANVVDTVGAGDAFTATVTLGMLAGWELGPLSDAANRVAAYVCGQKGATPELPADLAKLFHRGSA